MNIAIVGGGKRCKFLLNLFDSYFFQEIDPKVIAVADIDTRAPGYALARQKGLFVTMDYNDFFQRSDIDLIIELTESIDVYNDILDKKERTVRAIGSSSARLFWEISRISQQKENCRQKLVEAKAMYDLVINDLIQEDVMVIGSDYRIIDANETLLNKLGLTRKETIGKFCYEITHHQDQPCSGKKHPCPLIQTLETEKPSQTTHIHHDKDNRELIYSISTYPMLNGDHAIGAIEISRDITKDINMQKMMMNQEKLASIGRLSAGVAHEINNPLTTILTTAMLIQEDLEADDAIYKELETVVGETLRCRKIVTSLLDFARQNKPSKKPWSVNDIIKESIVLTQKQAAFKDIAIKTGSLDVLPELLVDKGQIQQAIINLIMNAIDATEPGGNVALSTQFLSDVKVVEIRVADTGKGIAPENLNHIIDPFFTTKADGNGLGLAITHGIVEQHNGSLDVTSELDKGSTFVIRLPFEQENRDAG